MRKTIRKIITAIVFLLICYPAFSQNKRFVAFCANSSGIGHAFISLGYEDPEKLMTVNDGAWGMYPQESLDGAKSLFIGEVPGKIANDFLTNKDLILVIIVDEKEYKKTIAKINEWRNKNYELLKSDCLSFLIEIAEIFRSKINVPERKGFENLPAEYLKAMISKNN